MKTYVQRLWDRRWLIALGLVILSFYARLGSEPKSETVQLLEVPHPSLEDLEKASQMQIGTVQAEVNRVLTETSGLKTRLLSSRAFGKIGMVYLAYNFPEAATACYLNAQNLQPDEWKWPYLIGLTFHKQGETQKAIDSLERALNLIEKDVSVGEAQQLATLIRLADFCRSANHSDDATRYIEEALTIDSNDVAALGISGRIASSSGNSKKAIEHLSKALELSPKSNRIRIQLAVEYRKIGDVDKAKAIGSQSADDEDLTPPLNDPLMAVVLSLRRTASSYNQAGAGALKAKQYEKAATLFRLALDIEPELTDARTNLASALSGLGQKEAAIAELQAVLKTDPDSFDANYQLSIHLVRSGDYEAATVHIQEGLKTKPNAAAARFLLAAALSLQKRFDEAQVAFAKLIETDPSHHGGWVGQIRMLSLLGRYEQAIAQANEYSRQFSNETEATDILARLLSACPDDTLRDGARGLALAQKGFDKKKTVQRAETLAMAFAETGSFDEAVKWQQWAITEAEPLKNTAVSAILKANLNLYQQQKYCRTPWSKEEAFPTITRNQSEK